MQKAAISFVVSIHIQNLSSHWTDFDGLMLSIFWKSVEKVQFALKSDKKYGYFHENMYIHDIILQDSYSEEWKSENSFCVSNSFLKIGEKYGRGRQTTNDNIMWYN